MLDNISEVSLQLSSDESALDVIEESNDPARKRKLEKIDVQGNGIESVNHDLDAKQFAKELERELLKTEEKTEEPILKKAKQEEVRSEAYTHGYQNGLSRIELTSNPIKSITVPKKYVKEEDKRDFRLGYKEGHGFMTKSLAEDEPIFYALGQENGEKYALETYALNKAPYPFLDHKRTSAGLHLLCFNKIYQLVVQSKLTDIYEKGFHLGYYYYWDLLDSYYQNYLKAYSVVIEKKFPVIVVIEPFQKENLTPLQREGIRQQAIAGYEEGTKFANLVISNNCQKNHLAFFKLQIQRLTKLYKEDNINWSRQRVLIAKLHPKAWENRSYILRNYFCPKHIEYLNMSFEEGRNYWGKVVQYGYTCKEEAISHFIFFQLLVGAKFDIIVTDDHVKIILNTMYHNQLSRLRSVDSLAKSVRWDDKIFFDEFLLSITKSPINQPEEKLRKGRHKKYTVFGHGFFLRSEKVSPYNLSPQTLERKKAKTSLHQSTSLITKDDQPIFGHVAFRRNKLVGYMFKPSKLINRIFFKDMGTINRPYEFDTLQEAEAYFNQKVLDPTPTMFKTLAELKQHIIKDKTSHNEVLARLKWDVNTSCIAIFSDTIEARCIAQFYAKLTYRRLLYQYRELNQTLPQDYKVPIIFYLPGSPLNWQIYSTEQQANDKIKAEAMFSDEAKIKEAFDQNNFEFLLLLDDLDHLSYQNLPLLFWCAYAYSLNIAEVLYQQTNSCFLISFEEYLKDTLLNTWRFESNCLYVERRNIFLSMALKLGIKDLPKEILKTKLIDEDNSNQYGNSLFQLVDAKEFELLTEILMNQEIDLGQTNEVGDTLLHLVARANHLELVKLLIEKGAKISVSNKYNETPLVMCIHKQLDNSEMVELFLGHNIRDELRAVIKACSLLNPHVLKVFFPLKRFSLGVQPEIHNLLLHLVISVRLQNKVDCEAQIQIVRMLLQAGADPAYLRENKSALQLAEEKALVDIVKELEASINKPGALPFISK
jgi:ankyrin repeat protein